MPDTGNNEGGFTSKEALNILAGAGMKELSPCFQRDDRRMIEEKVQEKSKIILEDKRI